MPLFFVKAWILVSSFASFVGWSLALSGHLNMPSYAVVLILLAVGVIFWVRKASRPRSLISLPPFRYFMRFIKSPSTHLSWLPLLFLFVALLTLLGGILYSPSNYDALSYRLPRILHWIDAGRWHWIDTPNARQNYSASGFEWLATPLFLFCKTDRPLFLINWFSFLLLPGLVFHSFRLAGIRQKTCWWWMWLLPLGYGYVQQSGSMGNDAFATVYALASVCFVLSADQKERFLDFGWAILAVALLTGVKASNLPLALPWLVAMLSRCSLWLPLMKKLLPWAIVAMGVSFAPIAILNSQHTGSWSGDPFNQSKINLSSPAAGLVGNALMLGYNSFQPPFLPSPAKVNRFSTDLLPVRLRQWLSFEFPRFQLKMGEIPMEESAGVGFGLTACLMLWILLGKSARSPGSDFRVQPWFVLGLAGLGSLFFYMTKMGTESTARLLLPYYPFLLLLPLGRWHLSGPTARRWAPAFFLLASSVMLGLIASPARPLFPVEKLLNMISKNPRFSRLNVVYETYMRRPWCWDPILGILPPGIQTLGFFSNEDDLEAPLWKPYRIRRVLSTEENHPVFHHLPYAEAWLARGPVAQELQSMPQWSQFWRMVGNSPITQKASVGPEEWILFLPR